MGQPDSIHNPVGAQPDVDAPGFLSSKISWGGQVSSETRWRWAAALTLAFSAVLFFGRLGARALWASEFRWGEIAREMLLTHNYYWPTINGRVYFDKPLGSYWLVVGAARLTGHMDEAATRLPGAISGLVAVLLLILLARRLYDLRTGVAAGFILATSFSFVFWTRTASADIETIAGELAALLLFKQNEQRPGWWVVPLWLIMALTSLMKGLLGFVLPLLIIGVYSIGGDGWAELSRGILSGPLPARWRWLVERNRWFFNWRTIPAVIMAALVYGMPFIVSHAHTGSSKGIYMVYRENIERYFAPFDHRGPIYLYLYVIFGLMAPWSVFLPAALVHAHGDSQTNDSERSDRFVLLFFWTTFVFFSLSGSRRSYYILPILPAAAILVARLFFERIGTLATRLLTIGFAVLSGAVAISAVMLLRPQLFLPSPYSLLPPAPYRGIFALFWLISLAILIYAILRTGVFFRRSHSDRAVPAARGLTARQRLLSSRQHILFAVCTTSYLLMTYLFLCAMPAGDQWRSEKPFAQQIHQLIDGRSAELAAFKTSPPVFYLGLSSPVPQYNNPARLTTAVRSGQVQWIVVRRRDLAALTLPTQIAASETVYPWDSREHRLNALILMRTGQVDQRQK